jgi:hypothetical protein
MDTWPVSAPAGHHRAQLERSVRVDAGEVRGCLNDALMMRCARHLLATAPQYKLLSAARGLVPETLPTRSSVR